jgi:hypothetical protein
MMVWGGGGLLFFGGAWMGGFTLWGDFMVLIWCGFISLFIWFWCLRISSTSLRELGD